MNSWPPRILLAGAVLTIATSLLIAGVVIPPLRADTFPAATPERAVPALWRVAAVNAAFAAAAVAGFHTRHHILTVLLGSLVLLVGLLLADAASALSGHGPAMHGATVALWVCVGCNVAGGALIAVAAIAGRRQALSAR